MILRWIVYLVALAVTFGCQLAYSGYLVHLIFLTVALTPWISLLLSLPVMLGLRVTWGELPRRVDRETTIPVTFRVVNPLQLPLWEIRVRLAWMDQSDPEASMKAERLECWGSAGGDLPHLRLGAHHCGAVKVEFKGIQVWDALGMFCLRKGRPNPREVLIWPKDSLEDPLGGFQPGGDGGRPLQPKPFGVGEDYDIRDYRPGDALRSVHWKLSAKTDSLVVREPLEQQKPQVLLTIDHFGARDRIDAQLDRLHRASRTLLSQGEPHVIRWAHPLTGVIRSFDVAREGDWVRCCTQALEDPMPLTGITIRDLDALQGLSGLVTQIHLGGLEGREA